MSTDYERGRVDERVPIVAWLEAEAKASREADPGEDREDPWLSYLWAAGAIAKGEHSWPVAHECPNPSDFGMPRNEPFTCGGCGKVWVWDETWRPA